MTPYTQLIQINRGFKLISAIYRDKPAGVKRVIVLERYIPADALTSDGGVKLAEVDVVAHRMLTQTNSRYLTHMVFNRVAPNGIKYAGSFHGTTLKHRRIQDMLIDVLTRYGTELSSKREIVREYF